HSSCCGNKNQFSGKTIGCKRRRRSKSSRCGPNPGTHHFRTHKIEHRLHFLRLNLQRIDGLRLSQTTLGRQRSWSTQSQTSPTQLADPTREPTLSVPIKSYIPYTSQDSISNG